MRSIKKRLPTSILLILMLTMSTAIIYLPTANASEITTYPFLSAAPSTVGVGQHVQLTMWLSMPPPSMLGEFRENQGWYGFTVEVTTPSGTETLGPFKTEATGSTYTLYYPDEVGNYTFKLSFPGQWKNGTDMYKGINVTDYYKTKQYPNSFRYCPRRTDTKLPKLAAPNRLLDSSNRL